MVGLISGFFRRLDNPIMRFMDALMAIPPILLALALIAALGTSLVNLIVALGITYTPRTARIIRSTVLSINGLSYIEAARAIGVSKSRLLFRHILVNCVAPLIVQTSFIFAYAVLAEATLSFLGVGPQPPIPSWGSMISEGRGSMLKAPWIMLFPGLSIVITVLGVNTLGDGLRDTLDPKHRVKKR